MMSIASTEAVTFSIRPCPYGCFLSGGISEYLTEKKVITDANKSLSECNASERILIEPVKNEIINLSNINIELDRIDIKAAFLLDVIVEFRSMLLFYVVFYNGRYIFFGFV